VAGGLGLFPFPHSVVAEGRVRVLVHFEYNKGIGAEGPLHARSTFAGPPAPSPAVRLAAQSHSGLGHFSTVSDQGEIKEGKEAIFYAGCQPGLSQNPFSRTLLLMVHRSVVRPVQPWRKVSTTVRSASSGSTRSAL
jgi:hypothetical protein